VWRFAASGVIATLLVTTYFAWYLAVAALSDAHNNEAGGTARVTRFRQLIRFRVDEHGVTGYVISVEQERGSPVIDGGQNLLFTLRDAFRVTVPAKKELVASTGAGTGTGSGG
jgi:hypothetical protein